MLEFPGAVKGAHSATGRPNGLYPEGNIRFRRV
jgi:hypothetical protein